MTQLGPSDFAVDTEAASNEKIIIRAEDLAFSGRSTPSDCVNRESSQWNHLFSGSWMSRFAYDESSLNSEFVEETLSFKNRLLMVRECCDRHDIFEPNHEDKLSFVLRTKSEIFGMFDSHFRLINSIVSNLTKGSVVADHHRMFYQYHLLPLLCTAPLNTRIYLKPLGYAGDYEIMNYYYSDSYCGDTAYQMLINRYTIEIPLARANINRRKILIEMFDELVLKVNGKKKIKIASIGCGPAVELLDLIDKHQYGDRFEFFCFDSEPLAVKSLMRNISEKPSYTSIDLHFHRLDVREFLRNNGANLCSSDVDFIYAAGLFDYFSDKHSKLALARLYTWLGAGGKVAIVNVSKGHGYDAYLELLGEWVLNARDRSDMLRISDGIECKEKSVFLDAENGQNIYLVLEK